jgi:hypothetical protein
MPAAWSAKDERQYKKVGAKCVSKRRCKQGMRKKATKTACRSACGSIKDKGLRAKCRRSCKTRKACIKDCNSLAARVVNTQRRRSGRLLKQRKAKRR